MSGFPDSTELARLASPDGRFVIVTTQVRDDRCCYTVESLESVDGSFRFAPGVGRLAFLPDGAIGFSASIRSESTRDSELHRFLIDPSRTGYRPAHLPGIWRPLRELEELLRRSQAVTPYSAGEPPESPWSALGILLFFGFCFAVVLYAPPRGQFARIALWSLSGLMVAVSAWGVWDAWRRERDEG